jgi:hypothetical protein
MRNLASFKKLTSISEELIRQTNRAVEWTDSHCEETSKEGVTNSIKNFRRSAIKVNFASKDRPSVAIFGQSQVGKSYLVKNIARPHGSGLFEIKLPGDKKSLSFINDINPLGNGAESSGVVTRFTTAETVSNVNYPIKVQLFNQLDIAAILANGYLLDLKDWKNPEYGSKDKIADLFESLKKSESPASDLSEDDLYDFVEYMESNLMHLTVTSSLQKAGYFDMLKSNLLKINVDDRCKVLELLWCNNSFMTDLFVRLTEGLKMMDYSNHVLVSEYAITPTTETIIDVQRVKEIFDSTEELPAIDVLVDDKKTLQIARSIFSCLSKEVELCIANDFSSDSKRSFMSECDVLDFPGSKSREKIGEEVFDLNANEEKLQLFIRGKVSYLFDSYTFRQKVSSLMYCMDNSPPEDQEAPARLKKWINIYVGNGSEARSERANAISNILKDENVLHSTISPLMLVLTKFNVEMAMFWEGQETDIKKHDSKWEARLERNFNEFMSRPVSDKWVENWYGENSPFKFVFPIRDPNHSKSFFDSKDGEETGINEDHKIIIKSMGQSFTTSEVVRTYVPDHEKVWKELISPGGIGTDNLFNYLAPAAHPSITYTRLYGELQKIVGGLRNMLMPHLVSGDIDEDLKLAQRQSIEAWSNISGLAYQNPLVLANFFNQAVVTDGELWNLLYDYKFSYQPQKNSTPSGSKPVDALIKNLRMQGASIELGMQREEVLEELRKIYSQQSDEEIASILKGAFQVDLNDFSQVIPETQLSNDVGSKLSSEIVNFWNQKLISILQKEELFAHTSEIQKSALVSVVNEIIKAEEKFEFKSFLSEVIGDLMIGVVDKEDVDLLASSCSSLLNNFFFTAGWYFAEEEAKPKNNETGNVIFSNVSKSVDESSFTKYVKKDNEAQFAQDWVLGCMNLYEENVRFEYGVTKSMDSAGNLKLKEILSKLDELIDENDH